MSAGDTLTIDLTVHNGPTGVPLDLYVGLFLPDNQIAYFRGAGLASLGALPPHPITDAARSPGNEPHTATLRRGRSARGAPGTYQFFAALVRRGAVSDGAVDDSDLAAFELEAFTIVP